MKYKTKLEIVQYVVLITLFILGSIIFNLFSNALFKFYDVLVFAFLYVLWGYWHHGHYNRLNKAVILEYAFFALFLVLVSGLGLGVIRFF